LAGTVIFPQVPLWIWALYHLLIAAFIAADLLAHRKQANPTFRGALAWVILWVAVGIGMGGLIALYFSTSEALLYFTAYLVEYSLSFDNLFVFTVIFAYFAVPLAYQNKTLYLGILTAILLRGIFIASGLELIAAFNWMIAVFGAVLIYSGYRLSRSGLNEVDPGRNPIVRFAKRLAPVSDRYYGSRFTVVDNGKRYFTPLVLALLAIETTDIVFALDSLPAVIAITLNFFVAYTSNISAILGLRSLYTVLAMVIYKLEYLSKGLSVVLVFFGVKMILEEFGFVIPTPISIGIVLAVIGISALLSLFLRGGSAQVSR
jgi:tellurite resistance protein TerC